MRMIAKFPCILVLATWLSTLTQAVPLTDFDAKKLLVARKNLPSRDTRTARAEEDARLRTIYGQSQRIQQELAAQQLHVNPPAPAPAPALAELPEANPHVLIMRRSLYCLNYAPSNIANAVFDAAVREGCDHRDSFEDKANCWEGVLNTVGLHCPHPSITVLYEGYRTPTGVAQPQ